MRRSKSGFLNREIYEKNVTNDNEKPSTSRKETRCEQLFRLFEGYKLTEALELIHVWKKEKLAALETSQPKVQQVATKKHLSLEEQAHMEIVHSCKRVKKTTLLMVLCNSGMEEAIPILFAPYRKFLPSRYVNKKEINGATAFTYACRTNRTHLALFLLSRGLDVVAALEAEEQPTNSFWYHVITNENTKILQGILAQVKPDRKKKKASSSGNKLCRSKSDVSQKLFDVNWPCFDKEASALIESAKHGRYDMLKTLLAFSNIDVEFKDKTGRDALDYALAHGRIDVAGCLRKVLGSELHTPSSADTPPSETVPMSLLARVSAFVKEGNLDALKLEVLHFFSQGEELDQKQFSELLSKALDAAIGQNDLGIVSYLSHLKRRRIKKRRQPDDEPAPSFEENTDLDDSSVLSVDSRNSTMEPIMFAVTTSLRDCVLKNRAHLFIQLCRFSGSQLSSGEEIIQRAAQLVMEETAKEGRLLMMVASFKHFSAFLNGEVLSALLKRASRYGHPKIVSKIIEVSRERSFTLSKNALADAFKTALDHHHIGSMKILLTAGFEIEELYPHKNSQYPSAVGALWHYVLHHKMPYLFFALLEDYELVDVNAKVTKKGGTLLMETIVSGKEKVLAEILNPKKPWFKVLDPNLKDSQYQTPLSIILKANRFQNQRSLRYKLMALDLLLQHPAVDVNLPCDVEMLRPINICNHHELARRLMEDDRFNLEDCNGFALNALMYMCIQGRHDQVQCVIDLLRSKDPAKLVRLVNEGDLFEKQTPLMKCCTIDRRYDLQHKDHLDDLCKCAEVLLSVAGINLLARDSSSKTAFLHACAVSQPSKHKSSGRDVIDVLLLHEQSSGAEIGMEYVDQESRTGLFYAVKEGNKRVVERLLSFMSPELVMHRNRAGLSALDVAIETQHNSIVELFLSQCLSVDVNEGGTSPLIRAVKRCNEAAMKLLLAHPSFNSVNRKEAETGLTALHYAMAEIQSESMVRHLLAINSIDVNQQDRSGRTVLTLACGNGVPEALLFLLFKHPTVDVNVQDDEGNTALMHCVQKKRYQPIMLLSRLQVDYNLQNQKRETAMHLAVRTKEVELVKLLLSVSKHRLRLDIEDDLGRTPVGLAKTLQAEQDPGQDDDTGDCSEIMEVLARVGAVSGKHSTTKFYIQRCSKPS